MLEIIAILALPVLALGLAIYIILNLRSRLTEAQLDLGIAHGDIKALTNRVAVLGKDNRTLEKDNELLSAKTVEQSREIGRLKAEQVAAKPVRDPSTGKFASKPKPLQPDINLGIKRTRKAKA